MTQRIKIVNQNIIYELMDNEGILLDMDKGIYYSINNSGRDIWFLINNNYSVEETTAIVANHYDQAHSSIQSDVESFVSALQNEGLVEIYEDDSAGTPQESAPELSAGQYQTPQLDIYTDLQDLLMIDPIHEVDYKGWPAKQSGA